LISTFRSGRVGPKKKAGQLLNPIINIIVGRLEEEGIDLDRIPACIETIVDIMYLYPALSCRELNNKMQSLGWHNFEFDNHTFKLVKLICNQIETTPGLR
jgi:hypothetical protein